MAALLAAIVAAAIATKAPADQVRWEGQLVSLVITLVTSVGAPAIYIAASLGLGLAIDRRLSRSRSVELAAISAVPVFPSALAACLGISLMLTISHLLGWLGLMGGDLGFTVACVPLAFGLACWWPAIRVAQSLTRGSFPRVHPASFVLVLPIAILICASLAPPGWLWASEFGGYDSLSYHLQLPQEWLSLGRITPVEHNVYSFHPLYVEAAFYHLGVLTLAPSPQTPGEFINAPWGLAAGDGWRLISCQLLHAGLTLIAAWAIGTLAAKWIAQAQSHNSPASSPRTTILSLLIASIFLATPWTAVCGSLAYNEMGLMIGFAGAMLAALESRLSPTIRWTLAGWVVGVACGCKATALLFAGVPVGLLLLFTTPTKHWPRALLAGSIAGLVALSPWLVRNTLVSGNPVFPAASGLFGTGHWGEEQVARFSAAHVFHGSLQDRLKLCVLPDKGDPMANLTDGEGLHRGMAHAQWGAFFAVVGCACAASFFRASTRKLVLLPAICLLTMLGLWLFATHIQSRFLIPLLLPGLMAIAVTVMPLRQSWGAWSLALIALTQTGFLVRQFAAEHQGEAMRLLPAGPAALSGHVFRPSLEKLPAAERARALDQAPPTLFAAAALHPSDKLLLIGDATPLYYSCQVVYATTWDDSPLIEAIRVHPADETTWTAMLRAKGITHVLFHASEIERLRRSGFLDPSLVGFAEPGSPHDRWLRSLTIVQSWPGNVMLADLSSTPQ